MRPPRVLTWHVHGSYLYYLAHSGCEFHLPFDERRSPGYAGRTTSYRWPDNVLEHPSSETRNLQFDCILFQSPQNYQDDQYKILTSNQRNLPKIYLEHDPPRAHPTDTKHPVQTTEVLLVHVTEFNRLMWDSGITPTRVIIHGVNVPPHARYSGELARGLVVINNLAKRGRRLGQDIFLRMRETIDLDLIGMGWQEVNGLGEIRHEDLPLFASRYRFFFNPIRYTSLGLAVCEAMMVGLPIVGLATTELGRFVQNGVNGFLSNNIEELQSFMKSLLRGPELAKSMSIAAHRTAREFFDLIRFIRNWERVFSEATDIKIPERKLDAEHLKIIG